MQEATRRKLKQEMGIEVKTEFAFKFIYHTNLDRNLIEHELDHVFIGTYEDAPAINHEEVEAWKYITMKSLKNDILKNPDSYTYWFKLIINHPELSSIAVV